MKLTQRFLLFVLLVAGVWEGRAQSADTVYLDQTQVDTLFKTSSKSYPGVHDPSVVYNNSGTYYIFGSHNAIARTTDLRNWTSVNNSNLYGLQGSTGTVTVTSYDNAFNTNMTKTVKVLKGGVLIDTTFGNFDAEAWNCAIPQDGKAWTVAGNMWAPDVIYNTAMKKWCMYLSLNGPKWNSVIILLTASSIEGPYVYQGPVVYSGFRNTTDPKISWKLTDLELVIGTQTTLPSRYNRQEEWGKYLPHAIDPCVFYDEQGQLWMSYGSWSGGIYMLKLNAENGLRDYTATYTTDPYFGKQIAGGCYVSGEGSYIRHIGDKYYLFISYGGLEAAKGYTMRTFSSKFPDGPYVDNKGGSAIFTTYQMNYGPNDAALRGNLLVGAFGDWSLQTKGEVAQGHNSALVDAKGRAFVVYHTRFNTGNEFFQNRVHQLFTSKSGRLLSAPMEFNGEMVNNDSIASECSFALKDIPGTYSMLIHNYKLNNEALAIAKPSQVTLTADGKITGALTGTWALTEGTGYIAFTLGGVPYEGVVVPQTMDGSSLKLIGLTGAAASGQMAWAYKVLAPYAVAYNVKKMVSPVSENATVKTHLNLLTPSYFGATNRWETSQPAVIGSTGAYSPADTATNVTLTFQASVENYAFRKEYHVTAAKADSLPGDYLSGILAYYNFDESSLTNPYDELQKGLFKKMLYGTAPVLMTDGARLGQVAHVTGGKYTTNTGGYCQIPNPYFGKTGVKGITVSAWVKRAEGTDLFGTVWSFSNDPNLAIKQQRLFLTMNSYVGFTNKVDTFAINYPKILNPSIAVGSWKLVTVVMDTTNLDIYVNGTKLAKSFVSTSGTTLTNFDFRKVMDVISTSRYFALGIGNGISGATGDYDDLLLYERALTADDVKLLYSRECRVTDFTAGKPNALETVKAGPAQNRRHDNTYYDTMGRKVLHPTKPGLYFYNGEKIMLH